ncbi:MAG: InlB B-repeat-containing protein, partial [Prevotellaceae bacterium]|nr:InlB B-repeat-containing protein [Prevotellaceae bacterium]
ILYAQWIIDTFKVALNTQDGSKVDTLKVTYGGKVAPPSYQRTGYTLKGWYTKTDDRWDFAASLVAQDTTLYAKWDTVKYSITYLFLGESEKNPANPDTFTIAHDTIVLQPALPRAGHTWVGWFAKPDFSGGKVDTILQGKGDKILYAQWIIDTFKVAFNTNGGSNVDTLKVTYGGKVAQPTSQRSGYTLKGWYTEAACTTAWSFATNEVTQNITLYAKWDAAKYEIILLGNGGYVGSTSLDDTIQEVTYQSAVGALPAAHRKGYTFAKWNTKSNGSGKTYDKDTVYDMTRDIILYAVWNPVTYSITYHLNGGTNDNLNPATYTVSSGNINLLPATKDDYEFDGWYDAATDGKEVLYIAAGDAVDVTLYAQWKEVAPTPHDTSSLTSLTICSVNGTLMEFDRNTITKMGDTIRYRLPCDMDIDSIISVSYATPEDVNAEIINETTGVSESGDTVWVSTGDRGDIRSFSIKLSNEPKPYTVVIEKPYELLDLVTEHMGNLRVVNNNPLYNDGHTFKSCIWMDKNGLISTYNGKLYCFAGSEPDAEFDDPMYVILTTEEGREIRTCPDGGDSEAGGGGTAETESLGSPNASAYPNPVRAGSKIYLKDAVLFDSEGEGERYSTFRLFSSQGQQVAGGNASDIASGLTMPDIPGSYYLILDGRAGRRTIYIAVGQ